MLPVEVEIVCAIASGSRQPSGPRDVSALRASWVAYAAVDHDLSDMDILWLQLARHALDQSGQTQLAHSKGRGVCIALDACGSSGEQYCSAPALIIRFAAACPTRNPP